MKWYGIIWLRYIHTIVVGKGCEKLGHKRIKGKLYTLIYEYETGIKDNFLRGYVKGRIETYGEMFFIDRDAKAEPFNDYCMRLKNHLVGQVSNNEINPIDSQNHEVNNRQSSEHVDMENLIKMR